MDQFDLIWFDLKTACGVVLTVFVRKIEILRLTAPSIANLPYRLLCSLRLLVSNPGSCTRLLHGTDLGFPLQDHGDWIATRLLAC